VLSGLNLDFKGKPYGVMPMLMASADILHLLSATCSVCGQAATRSQRLVRGKPASVNDPVHLVSDQITYEPRCRSHHELRQ
jgi:thymidine kinase